MLDRGENAEADLAVPMIASWQMRLCRTPPPSTLSACGKPIRRVLPQPRGRTLHDWGHHLTDGVYERSVLDRCPMRTLKAVVQFSRSQRAPFNAVEKCASVF